MKKVKNDHPGNISNVTRVIVGIVSGGLVKIGLAVFDRGWDDLKIKQIQVAILPLALLLPAKSLALSCKNTVSF